MTARACDGVEALRRADVAMYVAKERGEPYRWYYPELDQQSGADTEPPAAFQID